jgi:hypothetical protein
LGELRDLVQNKWISSNKNINIWMGSNLAGLGTYYSNIEVQTADWLCQNLFNIGKCLHAEKSQLKVDKSSHFFHYR